jgi:hypothetical protein
VAVIWTIAGVADFNGDGKADILWRDSGGNLSMWLMNGNALLDNSLFVNVPPSWTVSGVGDFNGDEKADILWRDTAGNLSMWLMNGKTVLDNSLFVNVPVNWRIQ